MDSFVRESSLDFHDRGILLPFDIQKLLEEFLEDSYIGGLNQVMVITGKGKIVRPLVEKLLTTNRYVKSFKSAEHHNGGLGAFEVMLIE